MGPVAVEVGDRNRLTMPRKWRIDASMPGLQLVGFSEKTVMTEEDSEEHGSLIV